MKTRILSIKKPYLRSAKLLMFAIYLKQKLLMKKIIIFLGCALFSLSIFGQLDESSAKNILVQNSVLESIHPNDFEGAVITDNYTSQGIDHVYFSQAINSIRIHRSFAAIHGKDGKYNLVYNDLVRGLADISIDNSPAMDVIAAINAISTQKNYEQVSNPVVVTAENIPDKYTELSIPNVSESNIRARQLYYRNTKSSLKLAWSIEIEDVKSDDYINFIIDGTSGNILAEYNYTVYCSFEHDHSHDTKEDIVCSHITDKEANINNKYSTVGPDSSYNVFPWPVEAPHNGSRSFEATPWNDNLNASPNGWHSYGTSDFQHTRGNNVDAYDDSNNSNGPTGGDAARADGGANLDFDFALDVNGNVADYKDAAVTNLFYWNNVIHDVWWNYGFDEQSGNFQEENNSGNGGAASDYVRAEAQDGQGTCNANMSTGPDGNNPRMQMYVCTRNGVTRDGDFDNGVIVHEYGHGISIRLTGGPSTSGCLSGSEQMGEGWSDYFGMVMTIEPGDLGTDSRGMGTWLFGQSASGPGIRPYPYSTDFAVNPFTYDNIQSGVSVPHGVGSVWATMLWDLTWALIDVYGWDPDIYNGTGGNNIAMALVIEGLKQQPCNPGFVDGRDGILAADQMLYGGANQCLIWEAFANRGLGYSAVQGSSGSRTDNSEAFDLAPSCILAFTKTADRLTAEVGDTITFKLKVRNDLDSTVLGLVITDDMPENTLFVSATNSGAHDAVTDLVTWPPFDLMASDSLEYYLKVRIDPAVNATQSDIIDDVENGGGIWSATNSGASDWDITGTQSNSGSFSWFAEDVGNPSIANLTLASPVGASDSTLLSFAHWYDTEATWDGGIVEISTNGGMDWIDLENQFISNGYNSTIYNSQPGFSGNSGGFIVSEIDLSSFSGNTFQIRFQMNCDQTVAGNGWWIDDISLTNLALYIPNTANITNTDFDIDATLMDPILVTPGPGPLALNLLLDDISCFGEVDGVAVANATGGTQNYTYLWNTGATTPSITGLMAGSYSVTVDDGMNTVSASGIIGEPDSLDLVMSSTQAIGPIGTASVVVSGGTLDYSYIWNTGDTTATIDDIDAGMYFVTVTDGSMCQKIDSVEVTTPIVCSKDVLLMYIQMDQDADQIELRVRDSGDNIVFEKIYDSSDQGQFVAEWACLPQDCYEIELLDSGGDGLCNGSSNPVGSYKFMDRTSGNIIDEGCAIGSGITRNFCYPVFNTDAVIVQPSCVGTADGSITLTINGGSGTYSYAWSDGSSANPNNNLSGGIYTVTIDDGVSTAVESYQLYNSVAAVYTNQNQGPGSLRFAVDNGCATDTIFFETVLMGDTISLITPIVISSTKVISGLGQNDLQLSGDNNNRIFQVNLGANLSLLNLGLYNTDEATNGGAIWNRGTLNVENVIFDNNKEAGVPKAWSGDGQFFIQGEIIIKE